MDNHNSSQEGTLAGIGQELESIVDVLPIEVADEAMNRARAVTFGLSAIMGAEVITDRLRDIIWEASDATAEAIRQLSASRDAIQDYLVGIGLSGESSDGDAFGGTMRIGGLAKGVLRPTYRAYPRTARYSAVLGADMAEGGDPKHNARLALAHLSWTVPGTGATLLSDQGSTATVLSDSERVYKVFRQQPEDYSLIESEMAILTVLGREGVAPRPVILIDAPLGYRCNQFDSKNMFGGRERIVRMDGERHLPIIVSEFIDAGPVDELPQELLTSEFDKLLDVAVRHDLIYKDCRIWYDRRGNRAILLDVGEACHTRHERATIDEAGKRLRKLYPGYTDQQVIDIVRMEELLREILPSHLQGPLELLETARIFESEGMDGIHAWLLRRRNA